MSEGNARGWGGRWLEELAQDCRVGGRMLWRNPGFAATVVLTLALATGATTAIFSIVHSVLLRPLPFREPDRLVQVAEIHQTGARGSVLFNDLQEFRRGRSFDAFTGYEMTTRHLQRASGTERLTAVISDRDFFTVLGVDPIVGRTYRADDPPSVVVLSARVWQRAFQRDPAIVGRTVTLAGNAWDPELRRSVIRQRAFTVLGVMPDTFQFPYGAGATMRGALPEPQTDIWIPDERRGGGRFAFVTGRLKPGVTIAAATAELTVIEQRLDVVTPGPYRPTGVALVPLADDVLGPVRRSLWLLFGAVGLVLAAACANVANLLVARMTVRTREVVTRAALGAGRLRLARQFMAESLLLSLAGGLAGVAIARWGTTLLVAVGSAKIPRAHEVSLDWRAFAFLLLICVVTALLFGLAPALTAARADVTSVTKDAAGHATMSGRYGRIRDGLVVAEVALAFVLACGAVVVISELRRLQQTDTGMHTDGVLTLHLTPNIPKPEYYRLEARVAQVPGVEAAGLIQLVPLQNWGWTGTFQVRGRPELPLAQQPRAELRTVTPGYFRTMGIPLLRGRELTESDQFDKPAVILINDALARRYFPGEDPIGRETDRGIIVGVVGDVRQVGLDRPAEPEIYGGLTVSAGIASDLGMSLMVRAPDKPEAVIAAVRAAVRETHPTLAIFNVRTMTQVVADSLWELHLYRWLIGLFAALALTLAAIGMYGVISYSVTSRTRELAVRLALGSHPAALSRLVLRRGVWLSAVGAAIGAACALLLATSLPHVPAVAGAHPWMLAAVAALLLAMTLLACLVPAVRVARVEPAQALRHD